MAAEPSRPPTKKSGKSGSSAKKRPVVEEPSVLSGRMNWAMLLVMAMVFIPISPLGKVMGKKSPKSEEREHWVAGKTATIHVTVTTADYDKLACADPRTKDGSHCAYQSEKDAFARTANEPLDDNKRSVLQPYRTTDGQLLFMAGLWAQPTVAMRLHDEPARAVAETKLARFVVACEVQFLEEWENPLLRWTPREPWSRQGKAMVATPKKCEILKDSRS
ncbi:MAG TPA: hypothetical protein VLC09_17870 [Polyangiaceae bacterium]|nr:hypothetical protein [Polyangiaceae bacterium]